jgi:hypothetical protein
VLTVRTGSGTQSGTQRVLESQAVWSAMRADPKTFVLGAGTGAAYAFAAGTTGGDLSGTDTRDFSHDWYLELLWRTGVVGLAAWLCAIVSWLLFTGRGRDPHTLGCFAAVLAISLGAFTYQPFGDVGWDAMTGLLLGLGCRLATRESAIMQPAADGRLEEFMGRAAGLGRSAPLAVGTLDDQQPVPGGLGHESRQPARKNREKTSLHEASQDLANTSTNLIWRF